MITTLEKAKSWEELQARIYLDNMQRATTAILPQAILLIFCYGYIPNWVIFVLAVTGILLHTARWLKSRPALLPPDTSPAQALKAIRAVAIVTSVHGLWIGVAALLLLPNVPPTTAMVSAMIFFGIQAGSIATTTVHPPTFMAFSIPIFLGFSTGAVLQSNTTGLIVPPLYFVFLMVLYAAVRNAHAVLRSSYELRVQRNQALQRAEEANRQKSKFLATASHDLRQPAAALAFMSEELSEAETDPSLAPVVGAIQRSSDNINSLIETLFDLSKLDRVLIENQPQWVSLQDLVENQRAIVAPKAESKGLSFRVSSPMGYIYADPSHLQRWLGNLLDNAIKYTDNGEVFLGIERLDSGLQITVSDTGRGIPAAQLGNIWDDYFRAEENSAAGSFSLGLGLSIVKRLSELLEVQPLIDSSPATGTKISATFDIERYRETVEKPEEVFNRGRLELAGGKRLLVVDDNPDVAEALQRHLTNMGFAVDVVNDAPSARDKLKEPNVYNLLITDNRLPDNELGVDICSYANRDNYRLACLLISADDLDAELIPNNLQIRRLRKPLHTNQLRQAILSLLCEDSDQAAPAGNKGIAKING